MNKIIKNIYNLHMNISFDNEHKLYKYLEKECQMNSILFNKQLVIPINNYKRYDFGLHIMKYFTFYKNILFNCINSNNEYFYDMMKISCHENILEIIHKDNNEFNEEIINIIQQLNETYNKLIETYTDFNDIILWVFDKYELIHNWYQCYNNTLNINNIISMYYFLGTLEWFHIYILKILLANYTNTNIIIIGDKLLFNCYELQTLSDNDLRIFFKDGYLSHSVLYLISSDFMTLYDPDYKQNESDNKINILETILNVSYYPLKLSISIQSKTDDNYCIFHCIRIVEYVNKLNITFDNIGFDILNNYINDLIITTNESVMIHYIINLYTDLKYTVY